MLPDALLAILRVPMESRVRCQAPGCRQTVYQSIHVVRVNDTITVYGSQCFKIHFQGQPVGSSLPTLASVTGRLLTEAERQMLDTNTELLLEQLQREHAESLDSSAAKLSRLKHQATLQRRVDIYEPGPPDQDGLYGQDEYADPALRDLIRAREQGASRSQMLNARGLKPGDAGYYDFSLLLAKAGFPF